MQEGTFFLLARISQCAFPLLIIKWMVFRFFPPMAFVAFHQFVASSFFIFVFVVDFAPILAFILIIEELQRASTIVLHIMRINARPFVMTRVSRAPNCFIIKDVEFIIVLIFFK